MEVPPGVVVVPGVDVPPGDAVPPGPLVEPLVPEEGLITSPGPTFCAPVVGCALFPGAIASVDCVPVAGPSVGALVGSVVPFPSVANADSVAAALSLL